VERSHYGKDIVNVILTLKIRQKFGIVFAVITCLFGNKNFVLFCNAMIMFF